MAKYIELGKAIEEFAFADADVCQEYGDYECEFGFSREAIKNVLEQMPAADVAPVVHETPMLRYRPERFEIYEEYGLNEKGEMLYLKRVFVDEKNYAMYCPACGKRQCSRFKNFCSNCGAKMDGGKA